MQSLDPLRVEDVGLRASAAAGKLPRLHEVDLEALRFKEFEERNPVDPGGFHSDRFHTALLQPRGDLVKIGGIGAELPDWFGVTIGGDADHMHVGMNVDSGRVRVDELERRRRGRDGDRERPCMRVVGLGPRLAWLLRLLVWDYHGCLLFADGGGETRRRREPRGISGTFEVSPTGSIPRRANLAWQVANDKVEASRAMLANGQEAPEGGRPQTRVAIEQPRPKWKQPHEPHP